MTRFYTELIIAVAIISALLVWGPSARAQMWCGEYKKVANSLSETFGEVPSSMGLANNGSVVQVFASADGTWTILATTPKGLSCVMAAGEAWQKLETAKPTKSKRQFPAIPALVGNQGMIGTKRVIGVVCVQEGIDAFHAATLESPRMIETVLDILFKRGACLYNANGYKVVLKALYKSYKDYEGASVELWQVESTGRAAYTWNYIGK